MQTRFMSLTDPSVLGEGDTAKPDSATASPSTG